jgi:hypothetical protein
MDTDPISSSLVFRVVDVIWHISLMTSDEQAIERTEIDDTFHENVVQTVLSFFSDVEIGHDLYETVLSTIEHLEHRIGSAVSRMLKIKETLRDFQIIRTEQGYIGLAYPEVKPQDRVCIMYNCEAPHIMRKSDDHYVNIGPCWIMGLCKEKLLRPWQKIQPSCRDLRLSDAVLRCKQMDLVSIDPQSLFIYLL